MSARAWRGWLTVVAWHDGDTCRGVLEVAGGLLEGSLKQPVRFRVATIDAPELKTGDPGAASTAWTLAAFPPGDYSCWHHGRDTYGRTLVDPIDPRTGRQLSEMSLAAGMSKPYER